MAQFSTIYSEVGNLTPSTGVARDKLFTNEAYADIATRRGWSWLQSSTTFALVAGQRGYTVLGTSPVITDFGAPISVVLEITASGARKELGKMDTQTFEQLTGHSFVNGVPMFWTIQGGTAATTSATVVAGGQQQIVVSPPPTATAGQGVNLILRYWRSTASIEMSADTDVPLLPAQFHRMITMRACSIAMTRYNMPGDAAGFEQDFERQLQAALDYDIAMWGGDNQTLVVLPPVQVASQAPLTAANYSPTTRPLPQAV